MKYIALIVAAFALGTYVHANDTTIVVPGAVQVIRPGQTPAVAPVGSTNQPVLRWKELSGEVKHVYPEKQFVELKLDQDNQYIGVPVTNSTVGIYKDGHQYALNDLKEGDDVTVKNLVFTY